MRERTQDRLVAVAVPLEGTNIIELVRIGQKPGKTLFYLEEFRAGLIQNRGGNRFVKFWEFDRSLPSAYSLHITDAGMEFRTHKFRGKGVQKQSRLIPSYKFPDFSQKSPLSPLGSNITYIEGFLANKRLG